MSCFQFFRWTISTFWLTHIVLLLTSTTAVPRRLVTCNSVSLPQDFRSERTADDFVWRHLLAREQLIQPLDVNSCFGEVSGLSLRHNGFASAAFAFRSPRGLLQARKEGRSGHEVGADFETKLPSAVGRDSLQVLVRFWRQQKRKVTKENRYVTKNPQIQGLRWGVFDFFWKIV